MGVVGFFVVVFWGGYDVGVVFFGEVVVFLGLFLVCLMLFCCGGCFYIFIHLFICFVLFVVCCFSFIKNTI